MQEALDKLCGEWEDIFLLHPLYISHTKLLPLDINAGDYPPITQKQYTLPLKHIQWVCEALEMLEKARTISQSISPWSSPYVMVPSKAQPGELPQKCFVWTIML